MAAAQGPMGRQCLEELKARPDLAEFIRPVANLSQREQRRNG
jgi:hypothetical protein